MTCGGGCRGQLADRVAGTDADQAEGVGRAREELEEGERGRHATSSGWATAVSRIVVRVGLGAVVGQVEAGARPRASRSRSANLGQLEPGGEETGGLGALTGRDDGEHRPTVP